MISDAVKKGYERVPNRSLFKALGLTDEEIDRPLIGVICAKSEIVFTSSIFFSFFYLLTF